MKKNFNITLILFSLMFMTTLLSCEKEEIVTPSAPSAPIPNLKPVWKIANSPSSIGDATSLLSNK